MRSSRHPRLKKYLFIASVVLLPVMFAKANQLANQSGNPSWFIGLRNELLATDTRSFGLLANAFILSLFTTLVYAIELGEDRKERLQYYASILISFLYAALSTGRSPFLQIIIPLIAIAAIQKRLRSKTLLATALFVVAVFGVFVLVLAKAGDPEAPLSENLPAVQESFVEYTIGALPAFDQLVRADPRAEYGKNMLVATVNFVRRNAGHETEKPDLVTEVPFPTNVYTAIRPPFLDFGIVGVVLAFGAIGAASSYSYMRAVQGEGLYIFFYSLSLYPLLMMTFDDQYFSPMLYWLKYLLAAYLYFRIRRKREIKSPSVVGLKTALT